MNKSVVRLMAGFRRFRERFLVAGSHEHAKYHRLAFSGQTPKTLLIGCSDSRVDPAILTDSSPGELFIVRNVANLVPPCEPSAVGFHGTSTALEFAVVHLKVENIIILGHRQCGGIRALMEGVPGNSDTFISQWMRIASKARENVLAKHPHADGEERCRLAEMESIIGSIENLKTFPFVMEALNAGGLKIYGVYFDLERGELLQFDDNSGEFTQVQV
jgi:carbonic anhydrase